MKSKKAKREAKRRFQPSTDRNALLLAQSKGVASARSKKKVPARLPTPSTTGRVQPVSAPSPVPAKAAAVPVTQREPRSKLITPVVGMASSPATDSLPAPALQPTLESAHPRTPADAHKPAPAVASTVPKQSASSRSSLGVAQSDNASFNNKRDVLPSYALGPPPGLELLWQQQLQNPEQRPPQREPGYQQSRPQAFAHYYSGYHSQPPLAYYSPLGLIASHACEPYFNPYTRTSTTIAHRITHTPAHTMQCRAHYYRRLLRLLTVIS